LPPYSFRPVTGSFLESGMSAAAPNYVISAKDGYLKKVRKSSICG